MMSLAWLVNSEGFSSVCVIIKAVTASGMSSGRGGSCLLGSVLGGAVR